MRYAIVLLICLVMFSGCGGGSTGTSSVGPVTISGVVQYNGQFGDCWVMVYKQGHEGDSKYIIADGTTGNDGSFKVQLPSAGTYDVDLTGDYGGAPTPPLSGSGSGSATLLKSWLNLSVPAGGVNLGTINVPAN